MIFVRQDTEMMDPSSPAFFPDFSKISIPYTSWSVLEGSICFRVDPAVVTRKAVGLGCRQTVRCMFAHATTAIDLRKQHIIHHKTPTRWKILS